MKSTKKLYRLIIGSFKDGLYKRKLQNHLFRSGQYEFPNPEWKDVSNDAKDLIKGCLKTNPEERLTIDMVIKNKWISVNYFKLKV